MLQQLFAAMNDLLDDIIRYYPKAQGELRSRLDEQVAYLRKLSDTIIDEWLHFEEKLAALAPSPPDEPAAKQLKPVAAAAPAGELAAAACAADHPLYAPQQDCTDEDTADDQRADRQLVTKGQGFFKLSMYREAAEQFKQAVLESPECNLARMFLAMTHMHLREWTEAQRHFLLLLDLTDHPKWQALALNALGCIQAASANMEQAETYFRLAHEADPTFTGPMTNLNNCRSRSGQLSLYFGSGELCCLREDRTG